LLEQKVRDRTSELRRAYRTLRQSEEQYRSIFESFQDVYFRTQIDGRISLVSPSVEAFMGTPPSQLIGRPIQEMYQDPAVFALITERLKRKGTLENLELGIKHADGSLRVGSLNIHTLLNDELEPVALEGVLRDITELRNAEHNSKSQQQQLIQADKMATLGILASGIAHEINNPNNLIMLNHDILASLWEHIVGVLDSHARAHPGFMLGNAPYASVREDLPDFLTGIAEGSIRIKTIVENLKDFARMDTGHIDQLLEINEVVRRAVFIVNNLIKKSTSTFELQLTAGLPQIIGNMQKLEQVVINLLTNACQALRSSSQTIRIQTLHATQPSGVELRVIDEGCGISAEDLPRIINPFFTTKRDSGGTGLGLSVSYSIIEEHGGSLRFASQLGKGTTVTVTLPQPPSLQTQSETIA
jgi:PAS domain S-box-containing protein